MVADFKLFGLVHREDGWVKVAVKFSVHERDALIRVTKCRRIARNYGTYGVAKGAERAEAYVEGRGNESLHNTYQLLAASKLVYDFTCIIHKNKNTLRIN